MYDPREQWASYLVNAIKAKELQKRDVNYIVRGAEIVIVDEFTGRTMPGRRWSDGLHQVGHSWTFPCVLARCAFASLPWCCARVGTQV